MKEITINLKMLSDCLLGVSTEKTKYFLQGVLIRDKDGKRQYAATNGHILIVHEEEGITDSGLSEEIILKPLVKIKLGKAICPEDRYAQLQFVDRDTALIRSNQDKVVCDIIDGKFPEFEKVLPSDDTEEAKTYMKFNPKYMKILERVIPSAGRPRAAYENSPAVWSKGDCKVVLMPLSV